MKVFRIVPMFRRNKEVECYIPQMHGFTLEEEADILSRISSFVPEKRWAFAEQAIPGDYSGVLVSQNSPSQRIRMLRDAQKEIIGYNLQVGLGVKELIERCHGVAIDIRYEQCEQLMSLLDVFGDKRTRRIALGITNIHQFEQWHRYGFDYFIGDFYTKAVIAGGDLRKRLSPVKANKLAILSEINNWNADDSNAGLNAIAEIIERDVYLTMSLLKVANSAFFTRQAGSSVNNLRDAVVRIGVNHLREWAVGILASDLADDKSPEISRVALLRAKFMENLAIRMNLDRWRAFMTGLLSVSGVMLGITLEEAIRELNVPEDILGYIHYQDALGQTYGLAESYLSGDVKNLESMGAGQPILDNLYIAYLTAETWVFDVLRNLA